MTLPSYQERFARYAPWSGLLGKDFAWATFVGSKVRHTYAAEYIDPGADRHMAAVYPNLDEEYFEWTDLVESIEEAQAEFVMLELGAGYGRWVVNGANFAKRYRPELRLRMIAVEAEKTHFSWMEEHIRDNELRRADFTLHRAAVGIRDGKGVFQMGTPGKSYGERLRDGALHRSWLERARLVARTIARTTLGRVGGGAVPLTEQDTLEEVQVLSLETLLRDVPRVDLVDMDIQGTELEVLAAAAETVDRKIVRAHIGTHSPEIEEGLRELFTRLGWAKRNDYRMGTENRTPWGPVRFGDGVQTWVNPRLGRADR